MKNRKKLIKKTKPIAILVLVIILSGLITLTVLAAYCNLEIIGSSCAFNDGFMIQFDPTGSAGSGTFPVFLKIQATGTEKGYNTDGALEFDTKETTIAILLSQVPQVYLNGEWYREFPLDINESVGVFVSLDAVQVFESLDDDCSGYNGFTAGPTDSYITCPTNSTHLVYDFDGPRDASGVPVVDKWAGLDYSLQAGSGVADTILFVPDSNFNDQTAACDFNGTGCLTYVYLYSEFGNAGIVGEKDYTSDDGFEEWGLADPAIFQPYIDIEKSTNGVDADEPTGPGVSWEGDITWVYTITNPGTMPISNVVVEDDIEGIIPGPASGDTDLDGQLDLDEEWIYEASGQCTVAGKYANIGTVTGQYGIDPVIIVTDEDPSHHWCLSQTAVTFDYFTATPQISNSILLDWATINEINNAGFNLYRSQAPDVLWGHLEFIQPQNPGGFEGAVYNFLDEGLNPGTKYYYTLRSVDVGNVVETLGTVDATTFYTVFLALIY